VARNFGNKAPKLDSPRECSPYYKIYEYASSIKIHYAQTTLGPPNLPDPLACRPYPRMPVEGPYCPNPYSSTSNAFYIYHIHQEPTDKS
jgi:hypothetical protein